MSSYRPPRAVDPKELKPGRFWYFIAALIMVVGVGAGITVFVAGLSSSIGNLPSMESTFEPGTPTKVDLTGAKDWSIYVNHTGEKLPADINCAAESSSGDEAKLSKPNGSLSFSDGDYQWRLAYNVKLSKPGEYTFTCTSGESTSNDFAVGEAADVGGFVGGIFGSIGGLIGIPCVSIVAGGVIILVVAMKRSSHKKRLQYQW